MEKVESYRKHAEELPHVGKARSLPDEREMLLNKATTWGAIREVSQLLLLCRRERKRSLSHRRL
jgi:hypothetical protein